MSARTLALIAAGGVLAGVALMWSTREAPPERGKPMPPERKLTAEQRAEGYAQMARALAAEGTPVRPSRPPEPGVDVPTSLPHPSPPPDTNRIHADALARAIADNAERPGEFAFRATVNAFMQHNKTLAERQAAQEGLTVEEVEELTYFGLMAQETQRWGDVEELIGRELQDHERAAGEALMQELNSEFKERMRKLVKDGAPAAERWKLIQEVQARYRQSYFELTGMNDQLLDNLLAGDASRKYAPGSTPIPEDAPPAETPPEPETRPEDAPDTSEG